MRKTSTRTETAERTLTKEQVVRALTLVQLAPEEEVVIRLRYGVGLDPEDALSYRGRGNENLEARLALIEKAILDLLEDSEGRHTDPSILDELKDL